MTLEDFLLLMNADLSREWTHLKFYLYHSSALTGLHAVEFREFFTDAAKGEMQHVQQFLDRLYGLGFEQPTRAANDFPVALDVTSALKAACALEGEVVTNYTERLQQLETVEHPAARYLTVFYEDQLQDSYEDCERMRRFLARV